MHNVLRSEDGTEIIFRNGTSRLNGTRQLYTHVPWYRCELVPSKCTDGTVRYPDFATMSPAKMNMANTPHFRGSQFHASGKNRPVLAWAPLIKRRHNYLVKRLFTAPLTLCHGDVHLEIDQIWAAGC